LLGPEVAIVPIAGLLLQRFGLWLVVCRPGRSDRTPLRDMAVTFEARVCDSGNGSGKRSGKSVAVAPGDDAATKAPARRRTTAGTIRAAARVRQTSTTHRGRSGRPRTRARQAALRPGERAVVAAW